MKSKKLIILVLSVIMIILSGCWNYKDLESMAIATGIAIDINKKTSNFIITIELMNQQSGDKNTEKGSKTKSITVESEGYTILDAMRNAVIKTGKKIFWGHSKVMIISQEIAQKGIIPVIDLIARDAETRPDIWILISTDNTAGEILKASNELGDITSFYLDDMLYSTQSVSQCVAEEFVELIKQISVKTTSVLAPTVYTTTNNGKQIPEIKGSGVFKQDKLVYFLNGDESKIALLVRNKLKGGILTINEKDGNNSMRISIEIYNCKVKLNPVNENNSIVMEIDAVINAGIAELEGSVNFIEREKREVLEEDIENILTEEIKSLVKKTQNNFSTDIFDFDGTIQRKMPADWRNIEPNWDEVYKSLKIRPNIKIDLSITSSMQKTIKIGD